MSNVLRISMAFGSSEADLFWSSIGETHEDSVAEAATPLLVKCDGTGEWMAATDVIWTKGKEVSVAPVVTIEVLSLAEQETFEEQLSDIEVFGLMEGVVIVQSWVVPAKKKNEVPNWYTHSR